MNFLRQSTDQARQVFLSMPMQSRIIVMMLVAVIAIGLAFLVRGSDAKSTEYLFGGRAMGEQEMDSIEVALSAAGLNEWQREGRRIKVPQDAKAAYLAALGDATSLPIALRTEVDQAIKSSSPFDSSDLRHAREMHAKEKDLGNKISAFPDVRWASVEYDRGERVGLSRVVPQSASVMVQPEGSHSLPRQRIMAIQELIRGSYAGMTTDDVVVIDTNSTTGSVSLEDEDPLLTKQREAEKHIEYKLRKLLVEYPAKIAVFAEIDPTMESELASLKFDPEPTNLRNSSKKIETTRNQQIPSGVPGADPNAIGNRAQSIGKDVEVLNTTEDERDTSGVAGQQFESSKLADLQVKTVRVSIMLPTSYYRTLHIQNEQFVDSTKNLEDIVLDQATLVELRAETEKKIQEIVSPLLPQVAAGSDPVSLVTVRDAPQLPIAKQVEQPATGQALSWLAESWQTLALVLLGLVALLVARSAAKSTGNATPPGFQEGFGLEMPGPPPAEQNVEEESERMTITGGSLKDELLHLVEDNPEVAANVIRGWVGDAA
jgi:flagellar M-ring protein FliF